MIKKPEYRVGDYVVFWLLDTRQEIRSYIFEVSRISNGELHLMSLDEENYSSEVLTEKVIRPFWLQKGDTFRYVYADGSVDRLIVEDLFFDSSTCLIVMTRSGETFGLRHNDFGTFDNYKFELQ